MELLVEIVSKETIKPSSPTPPNLKTYNLSLFDRFSPGFYISILLFYPAAISNPDDEKIKNISKSLKSSFSKTLTRFYPFAGKISDTTATIVECNDEGAIFIEARVHGVMASVLEEYSDYSVRKKFRLCGDDIAKTEQKDHLLQVQANFFECGGVVIGLSMSHKLADASTMSTFIKAWSTATSASNNNYDVALADFSIASILPAPASPPRIFAYSETNKYKTKRYMFDKSKISLLKQKAISEGVKDPTRVECISSLLWKCLSSSSVFIQSVNIRTKTIPPLSSNSIGNMVVASIGIYTDDHIRGPRLNDLIENMRRGVVQDVSKNAANGFKGKEEFASYIRNRAKKVFEVSERDDSYSCSSWCRFPFYEADFGWGKPSWVCPGITPIKNLFMLLDSRDGVGVEAWCSLSEEIFALLEQDQDFLTFASKN